MPVFAMVQSGGVLEHPGVLKDPAKVRDSWNAVYRGTTNAHKIAVLEEGMKYQQIGIPPEEAQFLEQESFRLTKLQGCFGYRHIWSVIWKRAVFLILSSSPWNL